MEKQILLKNEILIYDRIDPNFMCVLNEFIDTKNKIFSEFTLTQEDYYLFKEIQTFESFALITYTMKKKPVSKNVYYEASISLDKKDLENLILIIKKHAINAIINCNSLKLFLNDNDGDFLVVDTKNNNYRKLKELLITL